jgi:polyhydroxybutyrate depolymerase
MSTGTHRRPRPVVVIAVVITFAASTIAAWPMASSASERHERHEHHEHHEHRGRSAGCRRAPLPPGVTNQTLMSGGVQRQFQLTLPQDYTGRKPLPVLLGLHALTVSYLAVSSMTGFGDMASHYDFIGVAPSGRLDGPTPFWLAAPSPDNYDIRFFNDLLDVLESKLCVNTSRIYSTGMSNGAQMSSLLACRLSKRITAVAPVAGVEFYDTCRGRPVPVIAFHGTADPIVTYAGGGLNSTRIADLDFWKGNVPPGLPVHHGVDAAMQTWAAHNHCRPKPVEVRVTPEVRRRTWRHCAADTVLYIVDGGGHSWPGKPVPAFEQMFGHTTTQIDASTLIFRFLFDQRRH